jgi:predicted alpha/beta hydrolase family esterase
MKPLATVLIVPGLSDSGPAHWQSIWGAKHPEYQRVRQDDWETPRCSDWVHRLHDSIFFIGGGPIVLVGHSSACATFAHMARQYGDCEGRVVGALLVGPSDVEAASYPVGPTGFGPMPMRKLPFRSVVVASSDDPFVSMDRAGLFARAWGSRLITLANAGHINAASGYGEWPEGERWLEEMRDL